MDIGNSQEELLIKCNKKIYLQFGNEWIDVLDVDGNLNVRVKNIVNFRTPTSSTSDGFYYDGTNVYLKAGSDIINLSEVALPEGSIIMYEGDEAPTGWYKYADCDEFNGVIYIINKSGENAEYKRATVTLSYNPSTINYTLGETFEPPRLGIGYNTAVQPQFTVQFSSTNSTVASVDSNGQITPLSGGTAIIIAKIEDSSTVIGSQTQCTLNIYDHSGVRPGEDGVKSFRDIIEEFNSKGIYSPSIQNSGNTSDIYSYLEDMYNKSRQEYEGNSELFQSSTYENLEVYNYHGNNKEYELDGTAENAMLYWIIAMCISELVPTSGSNNKQTQLFKFAYDLGGNDGDGRKYRLYNNYTPKGDLTICRLVASVIYAKNRSTYKSSISSFRSKLNESAISISGTLKDGLNLTGNIGSKPTNYGYSVDIDSIFPAAAGPYSPSYTNRLNSPQTQQGENHDDFNSTTLNYIIDETINNTVVNNYNLRTSDSNIFKRAIQAISDDYEEVEHYLDDKIYYTYGENLNNDVTYPHDRFTAATSSSNKGYFTGTFNNSVVTSKNLSLYKNSSNFTNFLAQMKDACAWNRQTTFWPQYGRKRPSQGSSDCGCITDVGQHSDQNWLDDWGILNLAGGATKYDSNGEKYYVDRDFPGNQTDNREDNESSYYTHNCDYLCSTTYPSGHSAGVWGAALSLIELLSDMGITNSIEINNIYKAAYAFTVSRTIVRAHWNSDTIYGKLNTTTIFPVLHAMSTFDNIFDNAEQALNSTPTNKHNIDIAYVESFDSSPRKTGVKGTTFNQPTLYIKENNTVYTLDNYPYSSQLKPLLTYAFQQSTDTNYASINSTTGAVTLNNLTTGDGVRVGVTVQNSNEFVDVEAHFYIKIVEQAGSMQINAIIDNQTGEDAYITGEVHYFIHDSGTNTDTVVYTCSDENIANDDGSDGKLGDGESDNITLIKLKPGENQLHFPYAEYFGGSPRPTGTMTFRNNVANGITEQGVRVYAHGKTAHEKYAFIGTITSGTEFRENNITYKIKIVPGSNYSEMYKPSTPTSSISISPSSVSFQASGGTSSVSVTINSSTWSATSGASWCTANKSGNTLSISASANSSDRRTTTITITDGNNNTATVNVSQSGAGGDETTGKFAAVSDIHINNETKRDYFKTFVDYCASNGVSYIACAGDLLQDHGNDFTPLNAAINYATSKGITFQSCYGNHDSEVIYDLYHLAGGSSNSASSMTSADVINGLNNLNTKSGIIINEIPNLGIFIYLSLNYNYPGTSTFYSDGASCGSTKLSSTDVQSLLNICGSGCGYTSDDESYNYQYYSTSDLISLANILESNQSQVIYLFTHHPFRHKAALDAYSYDGGISRINPYKQYSTTDVNNKFNSMNGYGSNTLTGIQFYFLNWLNNKYKNVIWFTGHNHQPWGGNNYSSDDSYIVKPSGNNMNNYSKNLSNGISSALNINLPSLKSSQEAGIVEVSSSGIKLNEIKINGSTASKTGEYSYTFDRNYPYSNPPDISYENVPTPTPTGNGITFVITNNTGVEARLSGKVILNVSRNPNDWDNSTQINANIHGPQSGTSFAYNDIIIPSGGTYTSPEVTTIDGIYMPSVNFWDGTWYFMNTNSGEYMHSVFLYSRIWNTQKNESSGSNHMYVVTNPPQNTKIQKGITVNLTLDWLNPEATLQPDNSGHYVILSKNNTGL